MLRFTVVVIVQFTVEFVGAVVGAQVAVEIEGLVIWVGEVGTIYVNPFVKVDTPLSPLVITRSTIPVE